MIKPANRYENSLSRSMAVAIILFFIATFIPSTAQAKVYIDITSPSTRKFPIAIEDFEGGGTYNEITDVIRADLDFSGLFNIVGGKGEEGNDSFWQSAGAGALIKGKVTSQDNLLVIEAYLYDIVKGTTLLAKRYRGEKRGLRNISHYFANDVLEVLTGERGIFETRIAFVAKRGRNKEIYLMDYDGENSRQVTANESINLSPSWSPDGRELIYTSFMGGVASIYRKELATFKDTKLLNKKYMNMGGAWSPDGKKIALTISKDGDSDLFLIEKGGRSLKRLTSGWGLDVSPAWSPDGKTIVFVSDRSGNPNLYATSASGSNLRRLTFEGKYNASPAWSPDGKWIAYSSLQNGSFKIYIMKANGRDGRQLTFGTGNDEEPTWSPDGRFIAFSSTRGGKKSIFIISIDGSRVRKLKGTGSADMSPAWSPSLK